MSKRHLLLTTAAAAALVGAMTTASMAFDRVDWDWTNTVNQTTNISVSVSVSQTNPDVGQVEAGQAFLGNAASTANASNVNPGGVDNVTVDNEALSVLNNQSLNSDDTLLVHSGQFALGAFDDQIAAPNWQGFQDALGALALGIGSSSAPLFDGENSYTVLALATLAAAGNGYVVPATITANASLSSTTGDDLTNAATGMANSASWNVTGNGDDGVNGLVVGDLTQLGFANITTNATVNTIGFSSDPVLNNTATSVGNNLNVRVNSPVTQ
jgi:hypothetical protein